MKPCLYLDDNTDISTICTRCNPFILHSTTGVGRDKQWPDCNMCIACEDFDNVGLYYKCTCEVSA